MLEITLPWPPKELLPNRRLRRAGHWPGIEKAKSYRNHAYWTTKASIWHTEAKEAELDIVFYPPDRRRRDLDGMFSSLKCAIDGISECLGIDDYNFSYRIRRGEPIKDGKVVITFDLKTA